MKNYTLSGIKFCMRSIDKLVSLPFAFCLLTQFSLMAGSNCEKYSSDFSSGKHFLTMCVAPTDTVTGLAFGAVTVDSITLNSFTPPIGGATGYVIKVNTTNSFTAPSDGPALPAANPVYGGGEQVMYAGVSPAGVTITGLSDNTLYFFKVYAYNLCTGVHTFEIIGAGANTTTKQIPSITFNNIIKTYGDPDFDLMATSNSSGTISYSIQGAANGTSLSSLNNRTVDIGNVGMVTIRATVEASGNFISGSKDITLDINKANLIATADDKFRTYGMPNPPFTISYTGFKNGDDSSVINTMPTAMTSATQLSNPGVYPITLSGGADDNYMLSLNMGFLTIIADPVVALPNNEVYSKEIAPQGGLRYQRQFYLITPEEMKQSEVIKDSLINSIGFTIGAAQNIATKGDFKVYLGNTSDPVSRTDTSWTNIAVNTNQFDTSGLVFGEYEWQVQTVCVAGNSSFSNLRSFNTADTSICNIPSNLRTDNIDSTSATFHWTKTKSAGFIEFLVRYSRADTLDWDTSYTSNTSFMVNGLLPKTLYQWRVQTRCTAETSLESGVTFSTTDTISCASPSNLMVRNIKDSSAVLSWTAAIGATSYDIEFRRVGTQPWFSAPNAFTDSLKLKNLKELTPYEWRVRTRCADGTSNFITYPGFFTTIGAGVAFCYSPENVQTNVVNDSSVIMSWESVPGASGYNLRFRLKNSISWLNAINSDSMKLVHHDSIMIPNTVGKFRIPFKGMGISTIHYSGDGLYVAWEYSNSIGPLSTNNVALASSKNYDIKDKDGLDSISFILGLGTINSTTASAQKNTLLAVKLRPETWLGSPGLRDSVEVAAVYALGKHAISYLDTAQISARITNHSMGMRTYTVTLRIIEQGSSELRHTEEVMVNIGGHMSELIKFSNWVPDRVETDSIIISILGEGNENVLSNNRNYYVQEVNRSTVSYETNTASMTGTGFGTSSGLILSRFKMKGCGSVNGASVYLDFSAKNNGLYAVIMDAAGILIDSSDLFTPDSTEVNRYHTFYFPKAPFLNNTSYYIGVAQASSIAPGYFPVGVQWETPFIRDSAYYRANIDGSSLTNSPAPGRLMIKAEIVPGRVEPVLIGSESLCMGNTNLLKVGSKKSRFANRIIDISSEYGKTDFSGLQALGIPDIYPEHNNGTKQWIGNSSDKKREYIVLGFSNPAPINFIDIYETLNPGSIDTVYVKNPVSGLFEMVYSDTARVGKKEGTIKHISFDSTVFDVSEIRLALAVDSMSNFHGIDAVAIGIKSDTSNFASYQWSTGATTQSIMINTEGTYSVSVTDINACVSIDSIVVKTPLQTRPKINIVGSTIKDTTFCVGGSITIKSDKTGGNEWNTDATIDSIVVDTSGIYFLRYDDGSGCGILQSDTVTVSLDSLPVPLITGTLGFCPGGSTTLDAGPGYNSYLWSNDSISQTINVNTISSFNVTVVNSKGCIGKSSFVNSFNTAPIEPVISGNLSICPADSSLLDVGTYTTYSWSTGATSQTIYIKATESVNVMVTDSDGCIGEANVTSFNAPPLTPVITGDLNFCPGDSTILDAGMYSKYDWSTGDTSQTINVYSAQSIELSVIDSVGCSGSINVTTVVFTPPTAIIGGDLSFCPEDSTLLDAGSYISYLWSTGATVQSINVTTAGIFKVTVTDANTCTDSTSVSTSHFLTPIPSISGKSGFCPGETILLTAGNGYASYNWSTLAVSQSINVNSAANYTVTVVDNNGCMGSNSKVINQLIPPKPFIAGSLSFCGGSSVQLKAVRNDGGGFNSYLWNTGQTSQSIFVDTAGQYSVIVTDINACIGDTSVIVSTMDSVPATPGPITGPAFLANDSSLIKYSINPVPNTLFYVWTIPEGLKVVGRADSTVIVLSIDSLTSGEIIVEAANGCGLSPSTSPSYVNFGLPVIGDCNQALFVTNSIPIPTGSYQANVLRSAGLIANKGFVIFKPKIEAELNFNFTVEKGGIFQVVLDNCNE